MPKKGAGGKRHKRGKKFNDELAIVDAPLKDGDSQEYAQVTKMLGNGRVSVTVMTPQHPNRLGIIPGKFKKRKVWINPGDLVLLNIRAYQEAKCDIVYKYSDAEVRQLKKRGQIDKNYQSGNDLIVNASDESEDETFTFQDSDEEIDLNEI